MLSNCIRMLSTARQFSVMLTLLSNAYAAQLSNAQASAKFNHNAVPLYQVLTWNETLNYFEMYLPIHLPKCDLSTLQIPTSRNAMLRLSRSKINQTWILNLIFRWSSSATWSSSSRSVTQCRRLGVGEKNDNGNPERRGWEDRLRG